MKPKTLKSIGWLGNQLLAWCGLPMIIDVISKGSAEGYSVWFLAMWGAGEVMALFYMYHKHKDWPTIVNYTINLIFIGVVVIYKLTDLFIV